MGDVVDRSGDTPLPMARHAARKIWHVTWNTSRCGAFFLEISDVKPSLITHRDALNPNHAHQE
jgi:hypothetical protein